MQQWTQGGVRVLVAGALTIGSAVAFGQEVYSGGTQVTGSGRVKLGVVNQPPVCNTGGPYVVECNGVGTFVQLDATASFDPEQSPLTFEWIVSCPGAFVDDPTSPTALLFIDMSQSCELECGSPTIRLRVRDGQLSTLCMTAVFVQDTTPPSMTAPSDLVMLWAGGHPTQTDPTETGSPVAVDNCDDAPVMAFSDVVTPGVPPSGIEQIVTRTWNAVDRCGFPAAPVVQTMTIVGPSYYNLEIAPGSCPGNVSPDSSGTFQPAVLIGGADLDVASVDVSSLTLRRADGVGSVLAPVPYSVADLFTADPLGCHVDGPDGFDDVVVLFDHDTLFYALELDLAAAGTSVDVRISGVDAAGQSIERADTIVVGQAAGF